MTATVDRLFSWKTWAALGAVIVGVLLLAGAAPALAGTEDGVCMVDRFNATKPASVTELNCTSNDVQLALYEVDGPVSCVEGSFVDVTLTGHFIATSAERWDVGVFISQDGLTPNRLSADTCYSDYLNPVSADNTDLELLLGEGPFYNGEIGVDDADTCGDIQQGELNEAFFTTDEITVKCQDTNGNGTVDIPSCTVWANSRSDGDKKPACSDEGDVTAETTAKCTCDNVETDLVIAGTLTLVKTVVNDHGGTLGVSDFPLFMGTDLVSSGQTVEFLPGTVVTASETAQAGYLPSPWGGDCAGDGTVIIAAGTDKTCTITNDDIPNYFRTLLTLVKTVTNDDGGTALVSDFPLFVDATGVTSGVPIEVATGIEYTASETEQTGYTASDWGTACAADGTITPQPLLGPYTCTITNDDQPASLTLVKTVTNDNGGTLGVSDFPLFISGDPTTSGTSVTLPAGDYVASETAQFGYAAGDWTGGCDAAGNVSLGLGENKTCTINNDDIAPTLTLIKTVTSDNGGTLGVSDFPLFISGDPTTSGTSVTLQAGDYVASETAQFGYAAGDWTGGCDAAGNVSLSVGENKTCTINNDDIAPTLTLIKTVTNDNGGQLGVSDFPLFISGDPTTSGASVTLQAGDYVASETEQFGYAAGDWTGGCDAAGNVSLSVGENKTCTINNDDIAPTLTLIKTVTNDNGGQLGVSDFPLFISGDPTTSGASVTLQAGDYVASETEQFGYAAGDWTGDCDAAGNVSLSVGENKTCTINNDDQPGTLIVKKVSLPANTGSFDFTTTGTGYLAFTLAGGTQNSQDLDAGSYTVTETTQPGWFLSGIGGDPNSQYDCTVTGSGGSTGSGDLATQKATIDLKNGDTVTCVFENTQLAGDVTRTQGFWATHPELAEIVWFGGTWPDGTVFEPIADAYICGVEIDTLGELTAGFWSNIAHESDGTRRTRLEKAQMQLLQQLLAAELNVTAFGSAPSDGSIAEWEEALCEGTIKEIRTAMSEAAFFNESGDSEEFTPGISANPRRARAIADYAFWDSIPPVHQHALP